MKFASKTEQKGVIKTLQKTQKFLTADRWIKGTYQAIPGALYEKVVRGKMVDVENVTSKPLYCAMGGLRFVDGPYEHESANVLRAALPRGYRSVEGFNDKISTTYRMIQALFSRAIKLAQKAGVYDRG